MTIRCWARIRSRGICGDNGGVHINSGIANKAFYEAAVRLGGYAWEKAGLIWYKTLCDRLKPPATFEDAVSQTVAVAKELFGAAEGKIVKEAWKVVGL